MGFTCLEVVAVGVMHCMAALPTEVGHKQQAMKHKSHHRFDAGVGMEGTMAAFMGNYPATSSHCSSDHGVEQPEGCSTELQGDQCSQAIGHSR